MRLVASCAMALITWATNDFVDLQKNIARGWHAFCQFILRDHIRLWLYLYWWRTCGLHRNITYTLIVLYTLCAWSIYDWYAMCRYLKPDWLTFFFADIWLTTYTCLEYTTSIYLILCWLPLDTHCTNDVLMTYNWYNLCWWCTHDVTHVS